MSFARPLVLLPLLLAACGGPPPVVERTLPGGIPEVINNAPAGWPGGRPWRATEDLVIGDTAAGAPASFEDIRDFTVDAQGTIYVVDRGAERIAVFDSTGAPRGSFGRKGEGPGELADPIGLAIDGRGRLALVDQGLARLTLFDGNGTVLGSARRGFAGFGVGHWQGGVDTAGRLVELLAAPGEVVRWSLVTLDPDNLTPRDTAPLPAYTPAGIELEHRSANGISRIQAYTPYTPQLYWALDPRRAVWWAVSDRYRVVRQDWRGDTLLVLERAWTPAPVTADERDTVLADLEWFRRQGGTVSASDIPAHHPALDALVVDQAGNLWVEQFARHRPRAWDVFSPAGRWYGTVTLPRHRTYLIVRGDRFYGLVHDEDGRPQVVRGRLDR